MYAPESKFSETGTHVSLGTRLPVFPWGYKMLAKISDFLFGCRHAHQSFPITKRSGQRRSGAAMATGTYVVCLDCGKEFAYDWQRMKILSPDQKPAAAIPATRAA
jgi:hypothetical protein